MTSALCLEFLLFFLSHLVYSEEPEPVFRAHGSNIEMGYCFGVDYIAVYRSAPEGDQLLGNSSANTSVTPPSGLQGRVRVNQQHYLLGLQISNLTHMDSGIYRKECWQEQKLVSQLTQQLFVCDKELKSQEIIVNENDTATELLCSSTPTRLEGTSVRWYREIYPSYKLTLLLDSSVSLKPLVEELQNVLKVKDKGTVLVFDNSELKNNQHFYCLVIKGQNCLSFKNMYLPDRSESREIFASQGDRVVLSCPSDGSNQYWETPLRSINGSSTATGDMHLSGEENFSLVIPSVSDEHSGDYSCVSPSLEIIYLLVLCPVKATVELLEDFVEGRDIVLECDVNAAVQRVQWYRGQTLMENELIHDSSNKAINVPQDLRDRLSVSKHGSSLTISNVRMIDEGMYFCVALGHEFLVEEDFSYVDDYNDEGTGDDEFDYQQKWNDSHRCISKQETILTWTKDNPQPDTTSSDTDSNIIVYAVVGLVVAVVVIGVIIFIVLKSRTRKPASDCELNTKMNRTETDDPSCTKRLTTDEH